MVSGRFYEPTFYPKIQDPGLFETEGQFSLMRFARKPALQTYLEIAALAENRSLAMTQIILG